MAIMSATPSQDVTSTQAQTTEGESSTEGENDIIPKNSTGTEKGDQMAAGSASDEPVPQVRDKHHLQDQTNLLPFKQVIVIFMGLSCALFCKSTFWFASGIDG